MEGDRGSDFTDRVGLSALERSLLCGLGLDILWLGGGCGC